MPSAEPLRLGTVTAELLPHRIESVGARLFLVLHEAHEDFVMNLTPEDARRLAMHLQLAACEAEARDRNHRRREINLTACKTQ